MLVFIAVIVFFQPIELPLGERITEVVITPQKDLLLPHLERLLSGRSIKAKPLTSENTRPSSSAPQTEPQMAQTSQGQIRRGSVDRAPTPPPEMTEGFNLTPPSEKTSEFSLNISPPKDFGPDPEDYLTENELDLLRYLSSETSSKRPLGTSPSTETYGARISSPGKAVFNINQIDISPWARDVLEKIQTNWTIPTNEADNGQNAVEITVTIGKDGELLNINIRTSSAHAALDQAALYAIRMSAPFPHLPDDFPNDKVEAHFLFRYDE